MLIHNFKNSEKLFSEQLQETKKCFFLGIRLQEGAALQIKYV